MSTSLHPPVSDWLDISEAVDVYLHSRRQFLTWIKAGRLPAYRPTKRKTLLKRSDVERFLESSRIGDIVSVEALTEADQ